MQTRALRIGVFTGISLATVALALSFVPIWQARDNPYADGLQWMVAAIVVPLYATLIVPAFALALWGRPVAVIVAAVLVFIALAAGAAIFWN